jgi:hypothetical protein
MGKLGSILVIRSRRKLVAFAGELPRPRIAPEVNR